jgi:hypothetical protein
MIPVVPFFQAEMWSVVVLVDLFLECFAVVSKTFDLLPKPLDLPILLGGIRFGFMGLDPTFLSEIFKISQIFRTVVHPDHVRF